MTQSINVIDLIQKAQELGGDYENVILSSLNDHVVRISRMTEPYFWHLHPNSDETFIGMEGTLLIELEDRRIELRASQIVNIPKGTKHRTAPLGLQSVNLTIERADMETVRISEP